MATRAPDQGAQCAFVSQHAQPWATSGPTSTGRKGDARGGVVGVVTVTVPLNLRLRPWLRKSKCASLQGTAGGRARATARATGRLDRGRGRAGERARARVQDQDQDQHVYCVYISVCEQAAGAGWVAFACPHRPLPLAESAQVWVSLSPPHTCTTSPRPCHHQACLHLRVHVPSHCIRYIQPPCPVLLFRPNPLAASTWVSPIMMLQAGPDARSQAPKRLVPPPPLEKTKSPKQRRLCPSHAAETIISSPVCVCVCMCMQAATTPPWSGRGSPAAS